MMIDWARIGWVSTFEGRKEATVLDQGGTDDGLKLLITKKKIEIVLRLFLDLCYTG